jgi:hypothetical protein
MSLSQQLKDLKQQRRESIKDLHLTYVHTRRDLTRSISPDRHIRRHLGVALGLAAITGMILAPSPGRTRKEKPPRPRKKKSRSRDTLLAKLLRPLLVKFVPEAKEFLPGFDKSARSVDEHEEYFDDPEKIGPHAPPHMHHGHPRPQPRSTIQPLIAELVMLFAKRLDIQKILHLVTHYLATRKAAHNGQGDGHHQGPRVTVADTGTIHTPPTES